VLFLCVSKYKMKGSEIKMTEQLKEQKDQDGYIYVYNPLQANFYAYKGVVIKATGVHPETKKVWYKFSRKESYEAYCEWCVRPRKK